MFLSKSLKGFYGQLIGKRAVLVLFLEKIFNIMSNLLSNAIKFTEEKGYVYINVSVGLQNSRYQIESHKGQEPYPSVSMRSNELGTYHLQLKVKDTGIGIPPEKLPYIFDRFYQVDDSSTRAGEGTGIGLALTKELIKLLNGKIPRISLSVRSG